MDILACAEACRGQAMQNTARIGPKSATAKIERSLLEKIRTADPLDRRRAK
jgi:hypothetical protein